MRLHKDGYMEADFMSFKLFGSEVREMDGPIAMHETILKRQGQTVGDALKMILAQRGVTVEEIRNFQLIPHYDDDYIEVIVDG